MQAARADPPAPSQKSASQHGSLPRTVHVDARRVLTLAALFALLAGLLLAWLGTAYIRSESDKLRTQLRADNERILRLAALTMTESLAVVLADLRFLGHAPMLDAYLDRGGAAGTLGLTREFANLITQKRIYDQIRFIDLQGMERIRVNHAPDGARVTPPEALQMKRSRDYFRALSQLDADEIYVSPMNLNVEHERIELPLKPMIRFGLVVQDKQGVRRGYLLINYRAAHLLDKLHALSDPYHALRLLDAQGEWLLGPSAEDAWSGQLPDRRENGFSRRHPTAWEAMRRDNAGALSLGATHIQFLQVHPLLDRAPLEASLHLAQPSAADRYHWHAFIENPAAAMQAGESGLTGTAILGGLAAAPLVLLVSFMLAHGQARQRALAETLAHAVDNLPVLIAYIDANQRFRFNNRAFLDFCGRTPKQLYGRHLRDFLGEDAYALALPHLDAALAGQRRDFELHLDQRPVPRDLEAAFIPNASGKGQTRGVYALLTDITLRKEAERRERAHFVELAQFSRLASVGEVAGEIAHQVNQPLAAIAMFSNAALRTLENGGDQSRLQHWMESINAQAKRAGDVVQRLRRFAHSGDIRPIPLDLNLPVREALAMVEADSRARNIVMIRELADPLPPVLAAPDLMEQVIYNLMQNGIRALAAGDPAGVVTVRTRADASRVWLEIHDNAPPSSLDSGEIAPDADPADHGSNIGLAISRSIIRHYQGDLHDLPDAAGGHHVSFYLPRLEP